MGPYPASLAAPGRVAGPALLVRQAKLPGLLAGRPQPGARDCDGPNAHDASRIPIRAAANDIAAAAALARHADRMARGLAVIVNILDPDIIVLGGGLSNMEHLYTEVPKLMKSYVFSDFVDTPVVRNRHGDSSGVRGAAWLWPAPG